MKYSKRKLTLHQRFDAIDDFRGLSYAAVINRIGLRAGATIFKNDGSAARIWSDDAYSIMLLFDRDDICLGVQEETLRQQ